MILFNTRDYDAKRDEVKFMDGKLRSKEAFYASGFNSEMIDGKYYSIDENWETSESIISGHKI